MCFAGDNVPDEQWFHDRALHLAVTALTAVTGFGTGSRQRLRYRFVVRRPADDRSMEIKLEFNSDGLSITLEKVVASRPPEIPRPDVQQQAVTDLLASTASTSKHIGQVTWTCRQTLDEAGYVLVSQNWEYFTCVPGHVGWVDVE